MSELAVEKKGEFDFNNEQLKKFLERALNHLNKVKKNDAEHIAHFLMGIKTDLPTELSDINLTLDDKQKKHLHNALRTNRYGLFGKEEATKTIEKLTALQEEVNFSIEWNNKRAAKNPDEQVNEEKADSRPTSHSEHADSKPPGTLVLTRKQSSTIKTLGQGRAMLPSLQIKKNRLTWEKNWTSYTQMLQKNIKKTRKNGSNSRKK